MSADVALQKHCTPTPRLYLFKLLLKLFNSPDAWKLSPEFSQKLTHIVFWSAVGTSMCNNAVMLWFMTTKYSSSLSNMLSAMEQTTTKNNNKEIFKHVKHVSWCWTANTHVSKTYLRNRSNLETLVDPTNPFQTNGGIVSSQPGNIQHARCPVGAIHRCNAVFHDPCCNSLQHCHSFGWTCLFELDFFFEVLLESIHQLLRNVNGRNESRRSIS